MQSLVRPNAPRRLPSDAIQQSYFKQWTLCEPPTSPISPVEGSPEHFPPFSISPYSPTTAYTRRRTSSPISPGTTTAQRRAARVDRRSNLSETAPQLGHVQEGSGAFAPGHDVPYGLAEEPLPLERTQTSSSAKSASSPISLRTRRLLAIPGLHVAPNPMKDGQPPREARNGFQWKHELSGHWFEIRMGRAEKTEYFSQAELETATPSVADLSRARPAGPDQLPSTATASVHTARDRLLPQTDTASIVATETSVSDVSVAASPYWKRMRPKYFDKVRSGSSSVRSLAQGIRHPSTPHPDQMYTGTDNNKYMRVEITDEDAPTYLPSEARRVHTPPLATPSPTHRRIRGFFFDYNAPNDQTPPKNVSPEAEASLRRISSPRTPGAEEREWYRVQLDAIDAENSSREEFAASVPDHLPSSPLCPRHPKHKSRGKGTCVFHGRNPSLELRPPVPLGHVPSRRARTGESLRKLV